MDMIVLADLHQLCVDSGCRLSDLPGVMNHKDRWREKVMKIIKK